MSGLLNRIAALLMIAVISNVVLARGLEVSPSTYVWRDVPLGRTVRMPARVIVLNSSDRSISYVLKVVKSPGNKVPELPDLNWVRLASSRLEVKPKSAAGVDVFIRAPESRAWRGKHYVFCVEVKEENSKGEQITLAGYPRIYVQTSK